MDENGDLLPPNLDTINVNLIGVMYTVKLAIYYIKQNPNGGSIVMTGSGSSTHIPMLRDDIPPGTVLTGKKQASAASPQPTTVSLLS